MIEADPLKSTRFVAINRLPNRKSLPSSALGIDQLTSPFERLI